MAITEWWICPLILGMLLLPGWAILASSGLWRHWQGLQRWIVALGLGIAFYPILFYFARWVVPFLTFGPYKLMALLTVCAGVIAWNLRHDWRAQFDLASSEWIALGIVGVTLLTRFWILRDHPYPAWTDSLHHTLLTQLTAVNGQLPLTLEPYSPVPLDQYHLGLYALTASLQWLAHIPAYTALLWMVQFLNGMCGVGVYLLLDRQAGRRAALVGAVVAGLLVQHPALYFNWGRFTQVAAQAIMLIAWAVTIDTLECAIKDDNPPLLKLLLATLLSGGVFLLHFRAAIFYGVLVIVGCLRLGFRALRIHRIKSWGFALGILAILTLLIVSPALWRALMWRITRIGSTATIQGIERQVVEEAYYGLTWSIVPYLVAPRWLMGIAVICALLVVLRRSRALDQVHWVVLLPLLGLAYQLKISWLRVTNLSGILIMFYLPLAVVVGDTIGWLLDHPHLPRVLRSAGLLLLTSLFCLNEAYARAITVEPFRYFLTQEDVTAMAWIRENVPTDAVFAINTYFWLPHAPHGADGGYWLPYFAERQTTAGTMLNNLGSAAYQETIMYRSQQVKRLESGDATALHDLRALGVTHIYLGARPHFAGGGLSRTALLQMNALILIYDQGGVAIFALQ
ncbi:MAG: hypothetical protein JXA33_28410 [Anaerolineae bacterium]|nr:hypothetical protein [Anaerolineae bacterium]